jgi:hypothetical protein
MRILTAVAIVMLVSHPVMAQPTSAPTSQSVSEKLLKFPAGKRLKTSQGTFQGYSLEEMKVLLKIDAEYRLCFEQTPIYDKLVNDYKELNENKAKQLILLKSQIQILNQDRDRITKKWTEENRLRHECENKPSFWSWVSWGVAAAATATAAILAGILVARD